MPAVDNKRVAKNAVALTIRMVLVTIVGLYTSRIVLEALGVDDYGIYGLVGGVVGMASFLNASMTSATSRFITFELGTGNVNKLKSTFSTALVIHFILALVVVLLAETVGLWFLNNKLVIPADRMFAANVLFQLSVFSVIVSFTQVPYAADIIAHEKMSIYAYFEIINVVLKLIIVYSLFTFPGDRLIFYAILILGVSILSALFYRWYCIHNFPEAQFSVKFDKILAKEMLGFSIYELYGSMCVVVKNQGEPIILNLFFGIIANAASSLALTVTGAIDGLTTSITSAFSPQIVKQYADQNINTMAHLMRHAVQFTLLAYTIIAIPCILEAHSVLYLWLGQTPKYSVVFLQLILIAGIPQIIARTNNVAVRATGHNKILSIVNGTFYLSIPVTAYLLYKIGMNSATLIYVVGIILLTICTVVGFWLVKIEIRELDIANYSFAVLRSIVAVSLALIFNSLIHNYLEKCDTDGWGYVMQLLSLFGRFLIYFIVTFSLTFSLAFSKYERNTITTLVKKRLIRFKSH